MIVLNSVFFFFFETHTKKSNICFNTNVHQKFHSKVIINFFFFKIRP